MKKTLIAALALLALSACSSPDQVASDAVSADMSGTYAESAPSGERVTQPSIIRTGSLTLVVSDVAESEEQVTSLVQDAGGRIDSRDVIGGDSGPMITLVSRIPAESFDAVLTAIADLGEVSTLYENSSDVTLQVIDLEARIATLTDSIARLRELQNQAQSVADLVAVETELANRQAELESLQSQRTYLADQVDFATLSVTLTPQVSRSADSPDFVNGLINGWYSLINLGAGALTALGFIIPFALPILIIVLVVRFIRQRKRVE